MNRIQPVRLPIVFLASILFFSAGFAGVFSKDEAGTTGATFLKIEVGARPVAMGGAFVAVVDDANATYWNPAGLANVARREVTGMHTEWLEDIRYEFLGYASSIRSKEKARGYGFSIGCLHTSGMEARTTETAEPEGTFSVYDIAVGAGYAQEIERGVFLGGNLKLIHQRIEDETAWSGAMDIGLLYKPMDKQGSLQVGCVVQNVGPGIEFVDERDPLPLTIKAGIGKTFEFRRVESRLTLALDVDAPIDNIPSGHVGCEFVYRKASVELAGRAGYKTTTISDINVLSGLSLGAGFLWKGFAIDYVWVPYGYLGNTHRISLTVKL